MVAVAAGLWSRWRCGRLLIKMSTLTISSFNVLNFHRSGTTARLKIWFGQDFVTAEDQLVMGGVVRSGSIYLDVACTVDSGTHILTIPAFSLPTTDDSSVRNVRATGVLFDASGAFVRNLFTGWIIPSQLAPNTDFSGLNAYNAASPQPPDPTYPSTDQFLPLIRATASHLNSLETIEFGDLSDEQNGSYISINDTTGRANFFAGGEGGAQYAGFAAVCGVGQAELYLQATDYNYFSFKNGIAKIGDGEQENNGTYIKIDDVAQLISLFNLPTSDPVVAGALWRDGEAVKISLG